MSTLSPNLNELNGDDRQNSTEDQNPPKTTPDSTEDQNPPETTPDSTEETKTHLRPPPTQRGTKTPPKTTPDSTEDQNPPETTPDSTKDQNPPKMTPDPTEDGPHINTNYKKSSLFLQNTWYLIPATLILLPSYILYKVMKDNTVSIYAPIVLLSILMSGFFFGSLLHPILPILILVFYISSRILKVRYVRLINSIVLTCLIESTLNKMFKLKEIYFGEKVWSRIRGCPIRFICLSPVLLLCYYILKVCRRNSKRTSNITGLSQSVLVVMIATGLTSYYSMLFVRQGTKLERISNFLDSFYGIRSIRFSHLEYIIFGITSLLLIGILLLVRLLKRKSHREEATQNLIPPAEEEWA